MPLHLEAELNDVALGLGGLVGVKMRPVPPLPVPPLPVPPLPVPVGLTPPEPLEWSTPVPAGAAVTVDAELVAIAVELEMGTGLGRDEPGLGCKVGCGSGGMVTSLETMRWTSLLTPRK